MERQNCMTALIVFRIIPLFLASCLLVQAGCAAAAMQPGLEGLDLSKKDQGCVQTCSATYSSCMKQAVGFGRHKIAADIQRRCEGDLQTCTDRCPIR